MRGSGTWLGAEGRNSWCQHVKYPVKYLSAPPRASLHGHQCPAPGIALSAQSEHGKAWQSQGKHWHLADAALGKVASPVLDRAKPLSWQKHQQG